MQENLQKRAQLEKSRRWILAGTAAAIIIALLITIAILDSQLDAAAQRSDQVLLSITQELQSELVFALRSYDGIYSTGADVDGSILPTVRQHLNTATALNNILHAGFVQPAGTFLFGIRAGAQRKPLHRHRDGAARQLHARYREHRAHAVRSRWTGHFVITARAAVLPVPARSGCASARF